MLVEFSVENYRSIQEKQTISMVASEDETMLNSNTFPIPNNDDLRLVTSAAIYGPNASGKSNLLQAMYVLKYLVLNSASRMQAGDNLPIEPFRLNRESPKQPTILEVIFIRKGTRYEYGIFANQERIYEEWLIAYPNEQQQNWFSREYLPDNPELQTDEGYKWSFGNTLKGEQERIKNFVRSNSLFLSHAAQNNHIQLREIFEWFYDKINKLNTNFDAKEFTFNLYNSNEQFRRNFIQLINQSDTGISDIRLESQSNVYTLKFKHEEVGKHEFLAQKIKTIHRMDDSNEQIEFEIDQESQGTQHLFEITGHWLYALECGEVLIVDELDRSLHPVLSKALIKMFNDPTINKNNAQLIFTTHDTTLLDAEIFRPDQVWFTEKHKSMTKLYSLLDFRPRENESLQKGYLLGRYGAIPFINGLSI